MSDETEPKPVKLAKIVDEELLKLLDSKIEMDGLFEVAKKPRIKMPRMSEWHIEHFELIFPEDDDWDPEMAGLLVADSNQPGSDDHDGSRPPYWARGYVPEDIDICHVNQDICTGNYSFPMGYSVHELQHFTEVYTQIPDVQVCQHLVVSMKNDDPAIDLYDRPYTLLPVEDSCISIQLGRTPKAPEVCSYAESGTFEACSSYLPWEEIEIGTLGGVPVTLDRTYKGNTYTSGARVFNTYGEMIKFSKMLGEEFVLTYNPIIKDTKEFFQGMMTRLEVTYGAHEKDLQPQDQGS